MKLLILGATGRTGRLVVAKAMARGHSVTALVRTASSQPAEGLTIVVGDPRRPEALMSALPGHDAVISCLGQTSSTEPWLVKDAAAAMLAAMHRLNIKRYVVISGGLLFPSIHPVVLLLRMMLARKLDDARAMEQALVHADDVDWTIVRPPHLKAGVDTMGYAARAGGRPNNKFSMQFTDLADFILDAVEKRQFIRQVVGVGSA